MPTRKSSGPHRAARHRRSKKPTYSMVPPIVAATAGVTLIAAGAAQLPAGNADQSTSIPVVGALDADPAARAAAADRSSRSGARQAPSSGDAMSLSEAAEAVTAERQRSAEAAAAEEAARADRASEARAEAHRTRWVTPLRSYELLGPEDEGVGLAAESGAPVYAMSTGTIRYAGSDAEYGQMIVIEHWDGTVTYYCYLSSFEKTGGEVAANELIGRVGNTGTTSASHLHLQIRPHGEDPVDPLPWLERRGIAL